MTKPTITVSYSELDAYRQCPFKHKLQYIDRWSKPSDGGMGALDKGTLWHLVLEAHYGALRLDTLQVGTPLDRVERLLAQAEDEGTPLALVELIWWMYRGYVERWGLDDDWQVLAVEHTALVPLFTPEGRRTHFRMKIKIDLVIEWPKGSGRVWIVDHKSHSRLPKEKDMDFEEQFGLYQQGLTRLGKKIHGLLYNAATTTQNKGDLLVPGDDGWDARMKPQTLEQRHFRYKMARTKQELLTIEAEALATCQTMYGAHNKHERHVNGDTCRWRCDMTEACLLGRRTGDNGRTYLMLQELGYRQDFARH